MGSPGVPVMAAIERLIVKSFVKLDITRSVACMGFRQIVTAPIIYYNIIYYNITVYKISLASLRLVVLLE